jgi:lysophospholipase L1-like esterase
MRLFLLTLALLVVRAPAFGVAATSAAASSKKSTKKSKAPRPPKVSPEQRAEANEAVMAHLSEAMNFGIQNAAAMVPFYEQLYLKQKNGWQGEPLRVMQFGDSHTASDDWAAALRVKFQQKFGDGGPGFTHAGHPFLGFRRLDSQATMSRGWKAEGLLSREGDGMYGIGGVSLTAHRAGETISLEAEGQALEFFYLMQPGGGCFSLSENGTFQERICTAGETAPAFYRHELASGRHNLTLTTLDGDAVRVFGWVLENPIGITWETLGINGAQAEQLLQWNEQVLKSQIERRKPALVVLAYGTNEARRSDCTYEGYKNILMNVVRKIRSASPTTSILIVGAPDQMVRSGRKMVAFNPVDTVLAAQRDAAIESGCAFWNLRAAMGGKGSMKQWVQAGLAQGDYVHLTSPGYRLVGGSLFELILGQYGVFQSVRQQILGMSENGPARKTN